ncbi:MAG: DUF2127 domain-containing protein [Gemmatimonadota bacterium]
MKSRTIHLWFKISVLGKAIDGVLEIVGGFLLLLLRPGTVHRIVQNLTQHELSDDSRDAIAHYFAQSLQHFSHDTQRFAALYLLWHGVVKVGLVVALLRERRWAYPVAIVAFVLFLLYQLYRYSHTHAPELLILSVVDVIVIVLTWLEYRRLTVAHGFE